MTLLFRSKIVVATALVLVLALLPLFGGATLAESPAMAYRAEVAEPLVVHIAPPISYPDVGETFDVEVWLDDVVDLGGFELYMDYDPAVVQITSHMEGDPPSQVYDVELGPFLGSTGRTTAPLGPTVDNTAGTLLFGGFSFGEETGASGSGILAIITLEGMGAGTSALHLYDVQVTDTQAQPLSVTTVDGSVDVHNHWGESWSGSGTGLTLASSDGTGVRGQSNAASGTSYGVYGRSKSTAGRGVYGYATASSGTTSGVYGQSSSTKGRGVFGYGMATSGVT